LAPSTAAHRRQRFSLGTGVGMGLMRQSTSH
jgi:hypothetical protein